jgi:hypothetical protein
VYYIIFVVVLEFQKMEDKNESRKFPDYVLVTVKLNSSVLIHLNSVLPFNDPLSRLKKIKAKHGQSCLGIDETLELLEQVFADEEEDTISLLGDEVVYQWIFDHFFDELLSQVGGWIQDGWNELKGMSREKIIMIPNSRIAEFDMQMDKLKKYFAATTIKFS